MKKILQIASLVAILGFGVANAEQSGGFLGAEIGYGSLVVPFDYKQTTTGNTANATIAGDFSGGGVAFGFIGGYKQFFNPYFGLRYYGNINVMIGKVSPKVTQSAGDIFLDAGDNRSVTLVNYAIDLDMLINFIVRERNRVADFGMFVGVGLGGNNWSGQAVNDIDDYIVKREQFLPQGAQGLGWKTTRNFFDFSLNVGLRTNIAVNHGLELALRMPLIKNAFLNKEKSVANVANITFKVNTKIPSYNITLRYTYSFGTAKKITRKTIKRKVKKPQSESSSTEGSTEVQSQEQSNI